MLKRIQRIGFLTMTLMLAVVGGSVAFALPNQAVTHAQSLNPPINSAVSHQTTNGYGNSQAHLLAAQLRSCQNRQNAINIIIGRIDTRAQNQITLFNTIATRVENFYTKRGKTVSNYSQLVAAVNTAELQANTDFGTLKSTSSFSCTVSNPKGMVTQFQSYLKLEISDLQNLRTAVKNLIVGVATANGVTVSTTAKYSTSQGGQ